MCIYDVRTVGVIKRLQFRSVLKLETFFFGLLLVAIMQFVRENHSRTCCHKTFPIFSTFFLPSTQHLCFRVQFLKVALYFITHFFFFFPSSLSLSPHAAVCNTSYFKVGEECQPCPGGSSRDIDDLESSCTCILSLVTSDGSTTTSDGPCNSKSQSLVVP